MDYWFIILLIICYFHSINGDGCKNEPKCVYTKVHGMKAADCFDRKFREFPKCTADDVEILDLSMNRIRKIHKEDFKRYTYLRMLYLQDNLIFSLDDDIFEYNNDITTLDLSINAISDLPVVIFHLPKLNSLYLGQNWNMNIVDIVERAKPITSPLVQLDISYIMIDDTSELPIWDIMPYLTKYNISGNRISYLTPKHFAGLCDLRILDTKNVTVDYQNLCDCWTINRWLRERQVKFIPFECQISETECYDQVSDEDMEIYQQCREQVEAIAQKSRLMKILIPISVIVCIILIIIAYYFIRKKREKSKKEKEMTAPPLLTVYKK